MATYNIPYQNLNLQIPDDGQVFRGLNTQLNANNPIYKRVGNTITLLEGANGKSAGQLYEEKYGPGSYYSIPQYNEADFQTPFANLGIRYGGPADISQFAPGQTSTPGGTITQTISPNNPNGIVVTNPQGQVVTESPSAVQALINGGATPQQAQQIAQAPQQAGVTPTGQQAGAVSTGLPQAGTTQPGVQALPNNGGAPMPQGQPAGQPTAQQSTYAGPSIVDYLNSLGQPSDFSSRATLAAQHGIQNYTGTAAQNTALLNTLRQNSGVIGGSTTGGIGASSSAPASSSSTGQTGTPTAPQTENGKTAMQNIIDTYNDVYKQLGLSSVKEQYEKTLKDQQDLTNKMNEEIAGINADPWLTEGERGRIVKRIQDKYSSKLDTLSNFAKLYDSIYKEGQSQAQFLVGAIQDDTQAALKLAQDKQDAIDKLMTDNTVVSANGREILVNKSTGAVIADLGASKVAGGGSGVSGPSSYQEWVLAGGQSGTGKTYAQYLTDSNVKAPTVAQQTVGTYAARLEQSEPTISRLQNTIVGMNPIYWEAQRVLPSYLQDAEFRQIDQASRNFINAVLRRESGAVISPSEFDNAYRQYLPRPNDDAKTLANKKANRQLVAASFQQAAGPAYSSVETLLGQTGTPGQTPSGIKYTVTK